MTMTHKYISAQDILNADTYHENAAPAFDALARTRDEDIALVQRELDSMAYTNAYGPLREALTRILARFEAAPRAEAPSEQSFKCVKCGESYFTPTDVAEAVKIYREGAEAPSVGEARSIGWWLSDLPNPGPYYEGTMMNVVARALGIDTEEERLVILREADYRPARPTPDTAADSLDRYCGICYHRLDRCSHCDAATPDTTEVEALVADHWHRYAKSEKQAISELAAALLSIYTRGRPNG